MIEEARLWPKLKLANNMVLNWLAQEHPETLIHKTHFISINRKRLEIYVFYKKNEDVYQCSRNGITDLIKDKFLSELGETGCDVEPEDVVWFDFDSHENIEKNYEGSYFFKFR